jgi:hypothetical protein
MKETILSGSTCPSCGDILDAATSVEGDARPEPGDLTICFRCGHLMAFGKGLALRELTDTEVVQSAGDRRILKIQQARRKLLS